jgi:hypothetical protein
MKLVRLSALRTGRFYPQEIFLVLISIGGWVDLRDILGLEEFDQWKIPVTQSELKPATFRLAAQCINPSLPDDNGDNHKKRRITFGSGTRRLIWLSPSIVWSHEKPAGFLSTLFFHTCLIVSSSVLSLVYNDTSENNRICVFKLPFQTPYAVSWCSITNTNMSLTSLHLYGTFTFQQRCHTRHPSICSLGRHVY